MASAMTPHTSAPVGPLRGTVRVPGDKSISHRALIFGALAVGETVVRGLLEGEDVLRTAAALRALGAAVERGDDGAWRISGLGVGGLHEPSHILDMGNSGTAARLLMGVLASHPFVSFLDGDDSLARRPMNRAIEPLARMGARFTTRSGGRLPLAVHGSNRLMPIEYRLPVASAQVKSAILLAGLNTRGHTTVIEPHPSRDHTENLMRHFGAEVHVRALDDGGRAITVVGEPELSAHSLEVPGDPSSAAFPAVAALVRDGSDITIENVGINPLRAGLYDTLTEMGADIAFANRRSVGGEAVADLRVRAARLRGIVVPPERAPAMIDEYPVLAVAAAFAEGATVMRGIGELRVKESDRIAAMAAGLAANGVKVEEHEDGFTVHGRGTAAGGGGVATHHDHRIAMSFLVMGVAATRPTSIDDARMIDTSFPGFVALMNGLGTAIRPVGGKDQ